MHYQTSKAVINIDALIFEVRRDFIYLLDMR